jgi:hypothetical protein
MQTKSEMRAIEGRRQELIKVENPTKKGNHSQQRRQPQQGQHQQHRRKK